MLVVIMYWRSPRKMLERRGHFKPSVIKTLEIDHRAPGTNRSGNGQEEQTVLNIPRGALSPWTPNPLCSLADS